MKISKYSDSFFFFNKVKELKIKRKVFLVPMFKLSPKKILYNTNAWIYFPQIVHYWGKGWLIYLLKVLNPFSS